MCCRFYFGDDTGEYIRKAAGSIDPSASFAAGDIRPSDRTTILTGRKPGIVAEDMRWGFFSPVSKQLVINARSETVCEKKMFAGSMDARRCVIAAHHFYEWDRDKQLVTFTVPDRRVIFMAGIWDLSGGENRFTVLTTAANRFMLPVHDRMPLILSENRISDWLYDTDAAREMLRTPQPELTRRQDYQQLRLPL